MLERSIEIKNLPVPADLAQGREVPLDGLSILLRALLTTEVRPNLNRPITQSFEVRMNRQDMNRARAKDANLTALGLRLGEYDIKELDQNGDVYGLRVPGYLPIGRYELQSNDDKDNQVFVIHIFADAEKPLEKKQAREQRVLTMDTAPDQYILAQQYRRVCYFETGTDMMTTFDPGIRIEVIKKHVIQRQNESPIHGLLIHIEGQTKNLLIPENEFPSFFIGNMA